MCPVLEKRRIALTIFVVALVSLIVWLVPGNRGPLYQGKSPDYWMNYNYGGPYADRMFRGAWVGFGSNAVPFLVNALNQKNSVEPKISYRSFVRGLPSGLRSFLPTPAPPAEIVRSRAASALGIIGTASRPAIPALVRTMTGDECEFVRSAATNALKLIDPQAAARPGVK